MIHAVIVRKLSKSYDDNLVLNNVSFSVPNNIICGILGVNGAGKTTLLESIEGLRKYQDGDVEICELEQSVALSQNKYGVQMQSASLPEMVKVSEIIRLYCDYNDNDDYAQLIRYFDIEKLLNQTYKSLSTGQKRKLHLVLAIVNNPEVVFLDEPTAGLDVEARAELHDMIRGLKQKGKTIVLSSHDMKEVEQLCDKIIFLNEGYIYFDGTVDEFRKLKTTSYTIEIKGVQEKQSKKYEVTSINRELLEIIDPYIKSKIEIEELTISRPTLEDVFLNIAKGGKR